MLNLSNDGLMPKFMSTKNKVDVPYIAIILHAIFSTICCYSGSIAEFINTMGWSIIGMPIACLGLVFFHYDDSKENPTQLSKIKTFALIFSLTFIVLGYLDSFPELWILNLWIFRIIIVAVTVIGTRRLKRLMTLEASLKLLHEMIMTMSLM